MKSYQPLVSIVTPVYNGSKYIEELIASVIDQGYPSIEHIIIDDGSNDNDATVEILKRYPHLRWWSRPNKGAYATMNEGLLAAMGEIVTFISSDDLYEDSCAIEDVVSWWRQHPRFDGVCGGYGCVDDCGDTLVRRVCLLRYPRWLVYYINPTPHCSFFVDRLKLVEETVMFDTSLPYSADRDWAVQMYRKRFQIGFIKRVVSKFRVHEKQRTNDENGERMLRDQEAIRQRYHLSPLIGRIVLRMQRATMLCGACLDDIHAGDTHLAWSRLLHGTWKAKKRDSAP